jgi:queuine tRNA-ribosyltransferase
MPNFSLLHTSGKARAGVLETEHSHIETPIFMPVGTQGTVKAVDQDNIKIQYQGTNNIGKYVPPLSKTWHGGHGRCCGLHEFMNWDGSILTDSGGYQVYSISDQRKIKEEGVTFRSHIDGSKKLFTPENVMDTQRVIGADIIMAFDECTPYPCGEELCRRKHA